MSFPSCLSKRSVCYISRAMLPKKAEIFVVERRFVTGRLLLTYRLGLPLMLDEYRSENKIFCPLPLQLSSDTVASVYIYNCGRPARSSAMYRRPLIQDYSPRDRVVKGQTIVETKCPFVSSLAHTLPSVSNTTTTPTTKISSYGPLVPMCGFAVIAVQHLRDGSLHREYRKCFVRQPLVGYHAVQLPALDYLHLVLDVNQQSTTPSSGPTPAFRRLSTSEYQQSRSRTANPDPNTMVYAIVRHLVENLKLTQYPIYILGRNGTFAKGCHIEIPDLVMPYYDVALVNESCRALWPQYTWGLSCGHYGVVGAQKYTGPIDQNAHYLEIANAYLPYAVFWNGHFWDADTHVFPERDKLCYSDVGHFFDNFNICKPIDQQNVKCLSTFVYHELPRQDHDDLRKQLHASPSPTQTPSLARRDHNHTWKVGVYQRRHSSLSAAEAVQQSQLIYKSLELTEASLTAWRTDETSLNNTLASHQWQADVFVSNIPHFVTCVTDKPDVHKLGSIRMLPSRIASIFTWPPLPSDVIRGQVDMSTYVSSVSRLVLRLRPFGVEHLQKVTHISQRHRNTVYYLLALMYLHSPHSEQEEEEYLHFLANFTSPTDRTIIHIIKILRRHTRDVHQHRAFDWYVVCLLNLLITEDVINLKNSCHLLAPSWPYKNKLDHYDLTVPSSAGTDGPKLPAILLAAHLLEEEKHGHHLLPLYRPVMWEKGSNHFHVWDNTLRSWTLCHNRLNVPIMLPDVEFLAGLLHQYRLDEGAASIHPVKKKRKTTPAKSTLTQELSNQIKLYWSASNLTLADLPGYLFGISGNGYVLVGGADPDTHDVYDILSLPMFKSDRDAAREEYDWQRVKTLLIHIPVCPFFRQFTTLTQHALEHERCQLDTHRDGASAIAETLNQSLEARQAEDQHTNITSMHDVVTYEMCSGGLNSDVDGRFTVPCNVTQRIEQQRRLRSLSYGRYHTDLAGRQWNKYVQSLVGYVKHYVMQEMIRLPSCLRTIAETSSDATRRTLASEPLTVPLLTKILEENLYSHERDTEREDVPRCPECACPLTHVLLVLTQIFSYDLVSLRYFMHLLVKACTLRSDKNVNVFLGHSNSGKTLLLQLVVSVLGNAMSLLSGLTAHKGLQDRTHDLIRGGRRTRLWYMDETSGHQKLNTTFFKQITGRSRLWLRGNYQEGSMEQLEPTLFIFGNSKPQFDHNCPALTRRLQFLNFRSRFDTEAPISFRRCSFPQFPLMTDGPRKRELVTGLATFILHAHCQSGLASPYYLCQDDGPSSIWLPLAVREATIIHSPELDIVRYVLDRVRIVDNPLTYVTSKRLHDLVTGLPNVLKDLNVQPDDAIAFVEKHYIVSPMKTTQLAVPPSHLANVTDENTWIIHGLTETDRDLNDAALQLQLWASRNQ